MKKNAPTGNWETRLLGELTEWSSGGTPSKGNPDYWNGDIPWISANSMRSVRLADSDRKVTQLGLENGTRLAPSNCILLLVRGSELHKRIPLGITARPVAFNQDVKALIPINGLLSEFLLYWLRANEPFLLSKVEETGIGAGKLDTAVMKALKVQLPTLHEQKAIASILGSLDDKIELNRRMNETLEGMARAIFKSWFVDFDPIWAKKRGQKPVGMDNATTALFPNDFENSKLGKIPKGWTLGRVLDIGNIVCGKTPSTQVSEYFGGEIPFITIPDMHGKIFALKTQRTLSSQGADSQAKKMLPVGSICVSCIATPGLVVITTMPSQTNQQINTAVPNSVDETYFWYWSLCDLGDDIRSSGSGGSVVTNLSTGRFAELPVLLPSIGLRVAYNQASGPLFQRILANEMESQTLATLRDTLLPKLMAGEIRVKDAEKFVEETRHV